MKSKAIPPVSYLQGKTALPIIEAYYEFNQLKLLYRQGWLKRGLQPELCESVAEHTLGVAILAMWLADEYLPAYDKLKVMRMALLHDFGEIYVGDITPVDGIDPIQKSQLESSAVKHILSSLPAGESYIACWEEFEKGESPEARFVRQIDRLEMALQASIYSRQGLTTPEEFMESARNAIKEPDLQQIVQEIDRLLQD